MSRSSERDSCYSVSLDSQPPKRWVPSEKPEVPPDPGLLTQSADFREQVIVHELLYMQVPKHGKEFKTLLRSY